MKASTQYTDLTGTVAADISDFTTRSNQLVELASHFNIDQTKYKVVGMSVYGVEKFHVQFICVDIERSKEGNEHIVTINIGTNENILPLLFKRLHIVLYNRYDEKYRNLDENEEINL